MEDDNNTASKLMNDEIKEARLYLEHISKDDFNLEEHQKENRIWAIKVLLDYITNLQEINNNLKEDFKRHINRINELTNRIEKAVEYIKEMDTQLEVYGDYDILNDNKNDLLNILNGRSDE